MNLFPHDSIVMIAATLNSIHPVGWVLIALSVVVIVAIGAMIVHGFLHSRQPRLDTPEKLIRHHSLLLHSHAERDPSFKGVAMRFATLHHDLVPDSGAAPSIQGEILRSINRLAGEQRRNGNQNWGRGYSQFVRFLRDKLLDANTFDDARRSELSEHIDTIESQAKKSIELRRVDNAFACLIRAAVDFCEAHSTLIPYTPAAKRTI